MKKQIAKTRYLLGLLMLTSLVTVSGCKHSLNVKNIDDYSYFISTPLQKNVSIGLMTETKDVYCDVLADSISNSLGRYFPDIHILNGLSGPKDVDVIADISITPNYKGSAWNFLINFPGFIVLAPVWNGYIYKVNYNVDVELISSVNLKRIDSFEIPVELDIRHADINRTWTNGMWVLDYGLTAFVGGLFYVNYDESVSPLLAYDLKSSIGYYVAQKIVDRVNQFNKLKSLSELNTSNSPASFANSQMGR